MEKQNQLPVEYAEIIDVVLLPQDKSTVGILQKSDLETLNSTLEKIKCFKRKYTLKKLTVTNVEDKPAREKLRLALADLRSERTSLKEYKLSVTKPYRDTTAYINSNYDKVIEAIEALEEPLIAHNKQVKIDLEAKEKEAENAKKQKLFDRIDTLMKAGITFDGNYYSIGSEEFGVDEISFNAADIESMTDGIFESQLLEVVKKNLAIHNGMSEKKVIEDERLAKEAADKAAFEEREKELFKEQQKLLEEKRIFEAEKEEMRLYKQKIADDKAAELAKEAQAEIDKHYKISELRRDQLREIGFGFDPRTQYHKYMEIIISEVDLKCQPHTDWNEIIKEAKEKISFELSKIELAKKLQDDADATIALNKAIADKKAADELAEQLAKEEMATASDEIKWNHFIEQLDNLTYFPFESKKYKNYINTANTLLAQISKLDK